MTNRKKANSKKNTSKTLTETHDEKPNYFIATIDLSYHPLIKPYGNRPVKYYAILEYFTRQIDSDSIFVSARLNEYKKKMLKDSKAVKLNQENKKIIIQEVFDSLKGWLKNPEYLLLCDLSLILLDKKLIQKAYIKIKNSLAKTQATPLKNFKNIILTEKDFKAYPLFIQRAIQQYRSNRHFWAQKETRYVVSANMSAGKSTLINALVGKTISCMKSEATTASLHYIYNKVSEDGISSEWDGVLTLDADEERLMNYDSNNLSGKIHVATYFSTFVNKSDNRFCFIDTPGVNSAINKDHGEITRKTLSEEDYDKLIYIFNATQIGTDEEIRHLKFVAENVSKDKVIFVVNKLDDFNSKNDSISESIAGIRNDLISLGYVNPAIYPISAYFSLLIKKCFNGEELSEDENDLFVKFQKKFSRDFFNLSRYYPPIKNLNKLTQDELTMLSIKCGLYGLENALYENSTDKNKPYKSET